jgi:hypothetical protein
MVDNRWRIRPDSVYIAVILWWTTAGLTALLAVISLVEVAGRIRSDDLSRVVGGALPAGVLVVLTITKFNRGRPVARVALTGMAVYCTWTLVIGLSVVIAGESEAPVIQVLIEITRTVCAIVATVFSFAPTARTYFGAYNAHATRTKATSVAGWMWLVGIAALAAQLGILSSTTCPVTVAVGLTGPPAGMRSPPHCRPACCCALSRRMPRWCGSSSSAGSGPGSH